MDASPSDPTDRHTEFVGLLTANHPRLLGYCLSLLGRRHDAEDVLQKASLTIWRRFDSFTSGTDFLAWATTICFYEARNFQRLAARSPPASNGGWLPRRDKRYRARFSASCICSCHRHFCRRGPR